MADALQGPVLVIEPRRVACRALAAFLAQSVGEPVGRSVGFRVRFEHKSCASTRVLFVTPGVALRMLTEARSKTPGGDAWPWAAVMIDEFHERGDEELVLVDRADLPYVGGPVGIQSSTPERHPVLLGDSGMPEEWRPPTPEASLENS